MLHGVLAMGATYLFGVGVYATHFPERLRPVPCRARTCHAHTCHAHARALPRASPLGARPELHSNVHPPGARARVHALTGTARASRVRAQARTFDLIGSSHCIWHVCVLCAALHHYSTVLTLWRDSTLSAAAMPTVGVSYWSSPA